VRLGKRLGENKRVAIGEKGELMTERIPIKEAAARLGVSTDTVRRRLRGGELAGERRQTPQGFLWLVELPVDVQPAPPAEPANAAQVASVLMEDALEAVRLRERAEGLERLVGELQGERDAWRAQAQRDGEAARELRVLLQNEQLRALPQDATPRDAPGWADAPAQEGRTIERQAPRDVRRRLWDWLRRKEPPT